MPYIKSVRRTALAEGGKPRNAGDLNYAITMLCKDWLATSGENYDTYNELIGVLECAKLELYRRKAAMHEDKKIAENGDVW